MASTTPNGTGSGFLAYVDVFAPPPPPVAAAADDDAIGGQEKDGNDDSDCLSSESLDSNWDIIGALDRMAPLNLPRLSDLSGDGEPPEAKAEEEAAPETGRKKSDCAETTRLCGYLRKYKLGARSLTRTFKKRWFVFADSTCNLLYYRTPQHLIPLGEINISHATFTFDIAAERIVNNIFEIRVHRKTYWLEADDRDTMIFWLQELQLRRRLFRNRYANKTTKERVNAKRGLVDFGDALNSESNPSEQEPGIIDNISMPEKTVGPTSAVSTSNRTAIKDISITNLKVEFRNIVSNIKAGRKTSNHCSPQSSCEDPRESVTACPAAKSPSPLATTRTRFPQFQDKFQLLKSKLTGSKLVTDSEGSSNCAKCKQLQDFLKGCQEDTLLILEELSSARELLKTAEREIQKLEANGNIYKEMMGKYSNAEYLKALSEKSAAEVELQSMIHELSERFVRSENQNGTLKNDLQNLREDQALYQANIGVKDKILIELSSRVAELEEIAEKRGPCQEVATNTDLSLVNSTFGILQEKCEAFELQNKLLNQEILEISQLLEQEELRGDQYQVQMTHLEAQFYELKSKHIYVLQEISKPQIGVRDSISPELVSKLLQDVVEPDKSSQDSKRSSDSHLQDKPQFPILPYDQYGFSLQFTIEGEDLNSVAGNFYQRSQLLKTRRMNSDSMLAMKWEKFLISFVDRTPHRSKELKQMLREGISPQFRGQVWKMCIDLSIRDVRSMCGSEYYKSLLEKVSTSTVISPIRHQVELDLLRTLPNNRHYECYDSVGIPRLKNVLLAFSIHNPAVGYCQGLNRLAAVLLLFLDEEDSFWGLVSIIEHLMPNRYYDHTLIAAHTDQSLKKLCSNLLISLSINQSSRIEILAVAFASQRVLKEVIAEKLPNLSNHFAGLGFDVSLFTFNWFLAVFIDNIPVETYLRIWDSFLYEGSKILFRYTVAILKFCEDAILSKTDSADLHAYMRLLGDVLTDVNRISQIAFNELNPFPMKMINVKRQFHLQKLKVELEELEKLREQFQNSYSSQHNANNDSTSDIISDDESP